MRALLCYPLALSFCHMSWRFLEYEWPLASIAAFFLFYPTIAESLVDGADI